MRLRAALLGLVAGAVACTSPEQLSPSGTVASASSAPAATSVSASGSASAAPALPRVKRDGEAEVAAIAPFDPASIPAEAARRVDAALAVCGGPRRGYSFDSDPDAPPPPVRFSLCKPVTHAKLLAAFASVEAQNPLPLPPRSTGIGTIGGGKRQPEAPSRWQDAVDAIRLALALDPSTKPAKDAGERAKEAFASANRRVRGLTRLEITMTPPDKTFEKALRAALPRFAFCYQAGVINNPNLQGVITINASVDADGWLSDAKGGGSLPDSAVVRCLTRSVEGLVLPAQSKGVGSVQLKLTMEPDPVSLEKESARWRAGLPL